MRFPCKLGLMVASALSWTPGLIGQTTSAKACALLPLVELQELFGSDPTPLRGSGDGAMSLCSVAFPDIRHTASITVRPPQPSDKTMGVAQRVQMLRNSLTTASNRFDTEISGDVGCYRVEQNVDNEDLLPVATCLQIAGGYLSLTIASDDPKLVSFEVVRELLHKAAASRK